MRSSGRINKLLQRLEKRNTASKIIVISDDKPIPEHDEDTIVVRIVSEYVAPGGWKVDG